MKDNEIRKKLRLIRRPGRRKLLICARPGKVMKLKVLLLILIQRRFST